MALFIEIRSAEGQVARTRLAAGRNRLTVRLGDTYRVVDDQTGLTPATVAVKRIDNHLIIDGLGAADAPGADAPSVELAEFYNICSVGSPCQVQIETAAGPVMVGPGAAPIGALADGSFVLYDPNYASTAPAAVSLSDGSMTRNLMYGLGALAVVGLAAGGGGGGGDDGGGGGGGGGGGPDGTLRVTSSAFTNDRTPVIRGEGEAGARILVRIDTNGDGTADVSFATTVGADRLWSIDTGTATPESGGMPPGGLPATSSIGITQTGAAGNTSLPAYVLTFDDAAPAVAVIAAVATDDVVNANEKQAGVVITGTAEPGATAVVTWGGVQRAAAVDANGNWQTTFEPAAVPADGAQPVSVTVVDAAGNASAAAQRPLSVVTVPATLAVSPVAGDNRVNAVESDNGIRFSGSTDAGGAVTVTFNGITRPATVGTGGAWQVDFALAELPPTPGNYAFAVSALNAIGNAGAVNGTLLVDRVTPGAPVIATPIAGDNVANQTEVAAGIAITGSAEPSTADLVNTVSVVWGALNVTATVGGDGSWTAVFPAGSSPANGASTVTATVVDAAGNVSLPSAGVPVTVDVAPPPLALTAVATDNRVNAAEAAAPVAFSGTSAAGATIAVNWGGVAKSGTAGGNGAWSIAFQPNEIPADGNAAYSVTATSPVSGNSATTSGAVLVDRLPPGEAGSVVIDTDNQVQIGQAYAVTGTADLGSTVSVTIGAATQPGTFLGATGNWSAGPFVGSALANTATVTVTDAAGNATSSVHAFSVVLISASEPPAAEAPLDGAVLTLAALVSGSSDLPYESAATASPATAGATVSPMSSSLDALAPLPPHEQPFA